MEDVIEDVIGQTRKKSASHNPLKHGEGRTERERSGEGSHLQVILAHLICYAALPQSETRSNILDFALFSKRISRFRFSLLLF
jgi:hypothetical protein